MNKHFPLKKLLVALVLWLPLTAGAQGIVFQDLPLSEALETAARQGKWVFVDCYTSWCGPCKKLAAEVFPQEAVGAYVNPRFVAVKYDVEQEAHQHIARDYGVSAYPTLLVLDESGTLVDKIIGYQKPEALVLAIETCFDKTKSLKGLQDKYRQGQMQDKLELVQLLEKLLATRDPKAPEVAETLYASLSPEERCSADYWYFYVNEQLTPLHAPRIDYVIAHYPAFCQGVGKDKVDPLLTKNYQDRLFTALSVKDSTATIKELRALRKAYTRLGLTQAPQLDCLYRLSAAALDKHPLDALLKAAEAEPDYFITTDARLHNHRAWALITDRMTQSGTPAQKRAWAHLSEQIQPHAQGYMTAAFDYIIKQLRGE